MKLLKFSIYSDYLQNWQLIYSISFQKSGENVKIICRYLFASHFKHLYFLILFMMTFSGLLTDGEGKIPINIAFWYISSFNITLLTCFESLIIVSKTWLKFWWCQQKWLICHNFFLWFYVIFSVHGIINRFSSRKVFSICGHVTTYKIGSSSISMREVIITLILWRFDRKNTFSSGKSGGRGGLGSSLIIWGRHYVIALKFHTSVGEGLKLKFK